MLTRSGRLFFIFVSMKIIGSPDNFGTSTIKTQFLPFDVSFFKSIEELEVNGYRDEMDVIFF